MTAPAIDQSWWAELPKSSSGTPLPAVLHACLSPELQAKPNLLIVGDIHGCIDELRALLDKVRFDPATWALVSVGDIVAKGPDSLACVQLLREHGAAAVRGNHEDNVLEAAVRLRETGEHVAIAAQLSEDELRWVSDLPLTLRLPHVGPGPGVTIVHAGLVPGVDITAQSFVDLLWMRDVKNGVGLKKPEEGSAGWAGQWEGPEHCVFGHDAQRFVQQHANATGLDSGCCYGNSLTAIIVRCLPDAGDAWAGREIVSVPAARQYTAPTRKGAQVGESPFPKQLQSPVKAATPEKAVGTPHKGITETPTKAPWPGSDVFTPKRSFSSLELASTPKQSATGKRACQVAPPALPLLGTIEEAARVSS